MILDNTIAHIEIPVKDLHTAKKFYESLFTWEISIIEGMTDLAFFKTSETHVGGAFVISDKVANGAIMLYIEVEDIPTTLKKIKQAGGTITKEKTEIGNNFGFYGEFEDIFGNLLGLWANK